MKHPTPSDFIVNVKESHVSVIFKPSDSYYSFWRLADPEDIARHGPLSRSPNARHAKTGDTGAYPPEESRTDGALVGCQGNHKPITVREMRRTPRE